MKGLRGIFLKREFAFCYMGTEQIIINLSGSSL